jgi:hypothetical protein
LGSVLAAALTLGAACNQEMPDHGEHPDGAAGVNDASTSSDAAPSLPDADTPLADAAPEEDALPLDAGLDGGNMDAAPGDGGPAPDALPPGP